VVSGRTRQGGRPVLSFDGNSGDGAMQTIVEIGHEEALLAVQTVVDALKRRGKTAAVEAAKSKLKELDLHLAEVTAQKRELLAFLAKHKAD